jgi:hypothetical protein
LFYQQLILFSIQSSPHQGISEIPTPRLKIEIPPSPSSHQQHQKTGAAGIGEVMFLSIFMFFQELAFSFLK